MVQSQLQSKQSDAHKDFFQRNKGLAYQTARKCGRRLSGSAQPEIEAAAELACFDVNRNFNRLKGVQANNVLPQYVRKELDVEERTAGGMNVSSGPFVCNFCPSNSFFVDFAGDKICTRCGGRHKPVGVRFVSMDCLDPSSDSSTHSRSLHDSLRDESEGREHLRIPGEGEQTTVADEGLETIESVLTSESEFEDISEVSVSGGGIAAYMSATSHAIDRVLIDSLSGRVSTKTMRLIGYVYGCVRGNIRVSSGSYKSLSKQVIKAYEEIRQAGLHAFRVLCRYQKADTAFVLWAESSEAAEARMGMFGSVLDVEKISSAAHSNGEAL